MNHARAVSGRAAWLAAALAFLGTGDAAASAPEPLHAQSPRVAVNSASGSGAFGRWGVDRFGLPVYRYTLDQARAPFARQPELLGSTEAWHQLGNEPRDRDGLQRRLRAAVEPGPPLPVGEPPPSRTRATTPGGFGYLRTGDAVTSTLYADRPQGARTVREFGVGLRGPAHRRRRGLRVDERVYAPLGGGPLLIHDVTIRNTGARARSGSWFEYWDANPYDQAAKRAVGPGGAALRRGRRARSACPSAPRATTAARCRIFAAALERPGARLRHRRRVASSATAAARPPAAVAAGRLDGGHRPGRTGRIRRGRAMIAFRAPWRLRPGRRVTLRYAYGMAHAGQIPALVRTPARTAAAVRPQRASVGALAAAGPARAPGARGCRASCSGPRTRCARARPTRSAAAGASSPRAATTSTTSASRARSATRSSTCCR